MHESGEEQAGPAHCTDQEEGVSEAFVVRVWLEEVATENRPAFWRGHITHAVSGTRRYFQELDAISEFVVGYLRAWGIENNPVEPDE